MQAREEIDIETLASPKAQYYLENCDNVPLFHENYGLRHPRATYNVSLSSLARRSLTVIEILNDLQASRVFEDPRNQNWEVPLVEATDHMLDALMEHQDDCGNIIKTFFEDANGKECKKRLNKFKKSIQPYRDHIGKTVNFLKHKQGRIRIIAIYWPSGAVIGYYVEGAISGAVVGPHPSIHPNSDTAFSFNYDLSFHTCCIYAVSESLCQALETIDRRLTPPISSPKASDAPKTEWKDMLSAVSGLPHVYFPDELLKDIPFVDQTPTEFIIEYPSDRGKAEAKSIPFGSRIIVGFRGDGVTKTFKLPYFKKA